MTNGEGRLAVGGGEDVVASTGEDAGDGLPQAVFVVGHEDGLAGGGRRGGELPGRVGGLVGGGEVEMNGGAAARNGADDQFTADLLDDAEGRGQPSPSPSGHSAGHKRPAGTTGVVVDLGGGTFNMTVMEYDGAELTVRATGGDAYLGGANFDKALFDYLAERFEAAHASTSTIRTRCRSMRSRGSPRTGFGAPPGPSTTSSPRAVGLLYVSKHNASVVLSRRTLFVP